MGSEKVKEIKKVLECCRQNEIENTCEYCSNCPASDWDYGTECNVELFQKTITLINELESENERLKHLREVDNKTMTTLRQANNELNECMDEIQDRIAELEKENGKQLKQFAEMLKEKLEENSPIAGYDLEDLEFDGETIQECIDETLKELQDG